VIISLFSEVFPPTFRLEAGESSWVSLTPHRIYSILWGVRTTHLRIHGLPRKRNIPKFGMGSMGCPANPRINPISLASQSEKLPGVFPKKDV
jgi:hypothetical protein